MKFSRLFTWITFMAIFAMAARVAADSDTWWHLAAGRWMVENQSLITHDPFSFTREGIYWQNAMMPVQVTMYLIYDWFGPGGINIWAAFLISLSFWVAWQTTKANPAIKSFVFILAAISSAIFWAARPYLITMVLMAVIIYLFEGFQEGVKKNLWIIPLVMLIWANSHGGFFAGFLVWLCYFAQTFFEYILTLFGLPAKGDERKRVGLYILMFLLMILAVSMNPNGPSLLTIPFSTVSRSAIQNLIQEWQSPNFHDKEMIPFAIALLLTLGSMGLSAKKPSLAEWLLVMGFGFMSLFASRNIALFSIVFSITLSRNLDQWLAEWPDSVKNRFSISLDAAPPRKLSIVNWALVCILGLAVGIRVFSILQYETNIQAYREEFPVAAVETLEDMNLSGNLFNDYNFGGYIIWALPSSPVFVDGRDNLYGDEIINIWLQIARTEEGWEEALIEYQIGTVLLRPGLPLETALIESGWQLIFEDQISVVLLKP